MRLDGYRNKKKIYNNILAASLAALLATSLAALLDIVSFILRL